MKSKRRVIFGVVKRFCAKKSKMSILTSFLMPEKTKEHFQKAFKSLWKAEKILYPVKISEYFCKRQDTPFRMSPVDIVCKALEIACKLLKKNF